MRCQRVLIKPYNERKLQSIRFSSHVDSAHCRKHIVREECDCRRRQRSIDIQEKFKWDWSPLLFDFRCDEECPMYRHSNTFSSSQIRCWDGLKSQCGSRHDIQECRRNSSSIYAGVIRLPARDAFYIEWFLLEKLTWVYLLIDVALERIASILTESTSQQGGPQIRDVTNISFEIHPPPKPASFAPVPGMPSKRVSVSKHLVKQIVRPRVSLENAREKEGRGPEFFRSPKRHGSQFVGSQHSQDSLFVGSPQRKSASQFYEEKTQRRDGRIPYSDNWLIFGRLNWNLKSPLTAETEISQIVSASQSDPRRNVCTIKNKVILIAVLPQSHRHPRRRGGGRRKVTRKSLGHFSWRLILPLLKIRGKFLPHRVQATYSN